jgi:hypothetical protein
MPPLRRSILLVVAACALGAASCGDDEATEPAPATRTYRMGFASTSPRPEVASVLATIDAWRPRADIALVTITPPWRALLADTSAAALVRREHFELVRLYRTRGLPVLVQVDATDGLAREREAPELVALGRSITEPAVQAAYREYVLAVDSILRPEWLALAMETNLVRVAAPAAVYAALRAMTAATAARLAQQGTTARVFMTVQVETAWGRLPMIGRYVGVAQDRADFPWTQALGLSSYPFLGGFTEPEDVPLDWYARLAADGGPALPMLVTEGGWSSASVTGVTSSPERQARWIRRQLQLADRASLAAITQITFTDLDLSSYPVPPGSILPLFAALGLVDTALQPKPALAVWDSAFARGIR